MQLLVFLGCLFKVQPRKHIFDLECQLIKLITAVFSSSPSAAKTYFSSPQAILFVLLRLKYERSYSHVHVLFNYEAIAILASDYNMA